MRFQVTFTASSHSQRPLVEFGDHEPQLETRIGPTAAIGQPVNETRPNYPFDWLLYDSGVGHFHRRTVTSSNPRRERKTEG